jgi:cytochrome b involved in lipid metabolism/protoporphyrinogen oxidase
MYDLIIVGGGIAGLYTLLEAVSKMSEMSEMSKNPKILLLESSNRLGGRIKTIHRSNKNENENENSKPFIYESGAGRFSDEHSLLMKLLKDLNLDSKIIPIHANKTFIPKNNPNKPIKITNQADLAIQKIIDKKYPKEYLFSKTLLEVATETSPSLAEQLKNFYAYYSELHIMNAYDSLIAMERDFKDSIQYYILAGGLEQVIDEIKKRVIEKAKTKSIKAIIKLNTKVEEIINFENDGDGGGSGGSVSSGDNFITLKTSNGKELQTRKLVLAIPQKNILELFKNKDANMRKLFNLVSTQPLYRVYAKYKKPFIDGHIITDSKLRFIIPYNDKGLIMITYTDGLDTNYWLKQHIKLNDKEMAAKINQHIKEILPNVEIPELEWIDASTSYWDIGAHYWKTIKNHSVAIANDSIRETIRHPYQNLWIVGEAFSNHQAWIEGSLETSHKSFPEIFNKVNLSYPRKHKLSNKNKKDKTKDEESSKKKDDYDSALDSQAITMTEVNKHNNKKDAWLVIDNNVYDITSWVPNHPGGSIILKGVGTDATKLFKGHSNYAKEKLKTFKIGLLVG